MKAAFSHYPSSFADLRQFVKSKKVGAEFEIPAYLDLINEDAGLVKFRFFPAHLITSDLKDYKDLLQKWDKKRIVNDMEINNYNLRVNAYKEMIN